MLSRIIRIIREIFKRNTKTQFPKPTFEAYLSYEWYEKLIRELINQLRPVNKPTEFPHEILTKLHFTNQLQNMLRIYIIGYRKKKSKLFANYRGGRIIQIPEF